MDEFGVWPGALAELVGRRGAAGLAVSAALAEAARRERVIALVDAGDAFDPQDAGVERCRKLLWVRCRSLAEAVKAGDLLARDGNRGPVGAPQNLYECADPDEYGHEPTRVAIAVTKKFKTIPWC